jgi:pantetheine-phosphate adenylyltransferase
MKNTAIFPGTFDPMTLGHVNLVDRARQIFAKIIIAVAESPGKKPLFSLSERVAMIQQLFAAHSNIEVYGFNGLLSDFAQSHQATILLRGMRSATDFDYEFQLATMNRVLNSKLESLVLITSEQYIGISSSIVREIAYLGGDIAGFVPPLVANAIINKVAKGE